jgi:hypothetical protein
MFCSACGNAGQKLGSYCTRCGARQAESGVDEKREVTPNERLRNNTIFSVGNSLMSAFAAILLYYIHWGQAAHWSIYVAAAICTIIACHQAVVLYNTWQLRQRLRQARANAAVTDALPAAPTAAALPPADASDWVKPPASVTEHTTRQLEPAPRRTGKG